MNAPGTPIKIQRNQEAGDSKPGTSVLPVSVRVTSAIPGRGAFGSWKPHDWKALAGHPITAIGLILVSLTLLGWNLIVRLPGRILELPVEARMPARSELREPSRVPLEPEAIARLRIQVAEAGRYLIQGEAEVVELVSTMERLALDQGWRAEVVLLPAKPAPAILRGAVLQPVSFKFQSQPNRPDGQATSAYHRLLAFLEKVEELERKIELVTLNLHGGQDGLQAVQAEFHFWTERINETAAAE